MTTSIRQSETIAAESCPPLVDGFGRRHTSLRVSVTDRCNIRCTYCMPAETVFLPREQLLSFEEIVRFVRALAPLGVDKVRLTGGEPLLRADLPRLVEMLGAVESLADLALTTNGTLLAEQAKPLRDAGLHRLNVSLDALSEATFVKIARRPGLDRVLRGIDAALDAGFSDVRLNAVAIRGLTEAEVVPLAEFAFARSLELRFIEYMPLDAEQRWNSQELLEGAAIRRLLEARFGPLTPRERSDPAKPSRDYRTAGGGKIGFINPVSEPFCGDCNRLRLTSEGKVRNCLFSTTEWDAREVLRGGGDDEQLRCLVRQCVAGKAAAHGINTEEFVRPERPMYQIGG